jgi:hypothetical protein
MWVMGFMKKVWGGINNYGGFLHFKVSLQEPQRSEVSALVNTRFLVFPFFFACKFFYEKYFLQVVTC